MSEQTQLYSTKLQQRNYNYNDNYIDFTSYIEPHRFHGIDDPLMDTVRRNEAMIPPLHSDEYETMRKLARVPMEEEEENEGNQFSSNQSSAKEVNIKDGLRGKSNISIDIWKASMELIPNYNKISKYRFKNLLYQVNPSYRREFQKYLSNPKLLSFIQKYAHLISMRIQLEMETDYWKHVIDGLLFAVQWLSQMPKNFTRQYSINWDYPRTEHNIRHRQKLTQNKLNQICQQLQKHSQKYLSCWSISDKTLIDQITNMISNALKMMIFNDLQNLHIRLEQKKALIQYDAYDIHLLKLFYDLQPTDDQKVKAEKIWRGKLKYCQRQIHQIKTNSFNNEQADTSTKFNGNNQNNIDRHDQQYQMPFLESFDLNMRTIIETRRANMANRTEKIISFQNISSSIQL